jgi:ATP-binding cassette subfamily F protein 3
MIALSMKEIEKYYAANKVLNIVSFEINEGEKAAIVGRNGCGKTTLFRIIAGIEKYEKGTLSLRKGLKLGCLEQVGAGYEGCTVHQVLLGGVEEVTRLRSLMRELGELEEMSTKLRQGEAALEDMYGEWQKLAENM